MLLSLPREVQAPLVKAKLLPHSVQQLIKQLRPLHPIQKITGVDNWIKKHNYYDMNFGN